ncbi:MAG TPA: FGGY family carbohydrate kinase, partial [Longimicrobiales bacterium]|nr:FGGY family carbohydrate kinase [Longimicrobiales bacterium]
MYLGIDVGTSSVKALLVDEGQRIVARGSAPLTVSRPHDGWSEQDPADWVAAVETAIDGVRAEAPDALASLRGIGLSGQMHGATLLDEADQPLRPCILWNDGRAAAEAAELDADPRFREITGNIVFPGFTAPKLVWVARHEPEVFRRVRKVLLPKDYVRLWLTGEHVSEMSDSAGTSWLDTGARKWSDSLLDATGMTPDHMPRLVEGTQPGGSLRAELASRWGIRGPVVVAGGAGDNAASACGVGTVAPGTAFVSIGTSGVLFAA